MGVVGKSNNKECLIIAVSLFEKKTIVSFRKLQITFVTVLKYGCRTLLGILGELVLFYALSTGCRKRQTKENACT